MRMVCILICLILASGFCIFFRSNPDINPENVREPQAVTAVYYTGDEDPNKRVELSKEMATKIVEIICRKPKIWKKPHGRPAPLPRGYFVVGKRTYEYYGFLAFEIDDEWGQLWEDKAFDEFWIKLNNVGLKYELLKEFKPSK